MAKRLDVRAIFLGVALLAGFHPAQSQAQSSGRVWRLPAQGSGRTATQTTQAPHVVVIPGPPVHRSVFPRYPVAYTLVPAILMSDGSVFANFGFGYEPVYRSCSGAVVVGQPGVIAGNGFVITPPQPPTYTQPVPAQRTASEELLPSNRSRQVVISDAARAACYSRDAYGRVIVYRF